MNKILVERISGEGDHFLEAFNEIWDYVIVNL